MKLKTIGKVLIYRFTESCSTWNITRLLTAASVAPYISVMEPSSMAASNHQCDMIESAFTRCSDLPCVYNVKVSGKRRRTTACYLWRNVSIPCDPSRHLYNDGLLIIEPPFFISSMIQWIEVIHVIDRPCERFH